MSMMPIRQDIEVIPADVIPASKWYNRVVITPGNRIVEKKGRLVLGWRVTETIGVAVVNPRGVAAGKKSVIVGE